MALRTEADAHVILVFLTHHIRVGLLVAAFQHGHNSLKRAIMYLVNAEHVLIAKIIPHLPGAIQQQILHLGWQILPRRIQITAMLFQHRLHLAHGV